LLENRKNARQFLKECKYDKSSIEIIEKYSITNPGRLLGFSNFPTYYEIANMMLKRDFIHACELISNHFSYKNGLCGLDL